MNYSKSIEKIPPIKLNFDLNDGCNLRCVMCEGSQDPKNQTIMQFDDFKQKVLPVFTAVDSFQFGCRREPLMTPYYCDAVNMIKQFLRPHVTGWAITNGMMLNDSYIAAMIDGEIYNTIRISFDGANKTTLEQIRKGAKYEKIINNVTKLVRYRDNRKSKVKIGFNFTIMRANVHELPEVVKLASTLGMDLVTTHRLSPDDSVYVEKEYFELLQHTIRHAEALSTALNLEFYGTTYRTRGEYQSLLLDASRSTQLRTAYCGMLIPQSTVPKNDLRANDGKLLFILDPKGNLNTPCMKFTEGAVGNLLENSFEQIINSPKFSYFLSGLKNINPSICAGCHLLRHAESVDTLLNATFYQSVPAIPKSGFLPANPKDKESKLAGLSKILLPRFDTLGDIILLEGFLRQLRQKLPKAELILIVRQDYASEVEPLLSQLKIQLKAILFNPYFPLENGRAKEVISFLDSLAAEKWDAVFCTTFNRTMLEDMIAARLTDAEKIGMGKAPALTPVHKAAFEQLGLDTDKLFDAIAPVDERVSEVQKNALFFEFLFNEKPSTFYPNISPSPVAAAKAQEFLAIEGMESKDFFICMPAGLMTIKIKAWPAANFAAVAKWAADNLHIQPIIVGHESEREIVERTAGYMRAVGVEPHIWLGQGGDLQVLAALLKKAQFYVGNDSAPMHLAAAVGTPTVGIFGGGHWPRFIPAGKKAVGVAAPLPCFYCNWDCIFGDAPCVRLVSVKDVIRAINLVLSDQAETQGNMFLSTNAIDPATNELVEKSKGVVQRLRDELRISREVIDSLNERNTRESAEYSEVVAKINNSLSWRVTRPLRLIGKAFLRRKK